MKKEKAIRVVALYEDFQSAKDTDKDTEWKLAFYNIWRYQMTWDFAYEIRVGESRSNGVFVDILARPAFVDPLISTMEMWGYREIEQYPENVGLVDAYDADVDFVDIEW